MHGGGGGGGSSGGHRCASAPARLLALLALAFALAVNSQHHLDLDDNTVTLGSSHACALERVDEHSIGGEIVCWGDNGVGQLDPPSGLFVQLSAAEHTTCAVSVAERVACWGGEGAIVGPARAAAAAAAAGAAAGAALAPEARALWRGALLQVSVGARHACAVGASDGRLVCWGEDSHGQVTEGPALAPGRAWVQVSCGGDACCGLWREEAAGGGGGGGGGGYPVACWGSDAGGLLRLPTSARLLLQVSVASDGHACGVTEAYSLVCWGSFVSPQGGEQAWNGTFLQVATAQHLSCALRGDGTLMCLGESRRLWSGQPTRGKRDLPPPPPVPRRDAQFAEITAQCVRTPAAALPLLPLCVHPRPHAHTHTCTAPPLSLAAA